MAAESWTGKTIGKYRLIEQLGRGGMAEVFKAYQPGLDRYVAIKLMHSFLAEDKDFLARFQREAKLVASMRHPNIVQVHDFDLEGGLYYMVMEFIDGETLKNRLQNLEDKNQWISIDEAVRIILAIGSALKYAHRMGMVHRDVKPANVMIDKQGNVILTDFGIAKIFAGGAGTQLTASGAMVGTPSYMAPEQGLGQPGDERSDIYSLGIMLYQLVTARLPFEADTPLAVVLKHINEPMPMPSQVNPEVSESIERVVLRATVKNPNDRYQHIGEMLNDLKRAVGVSLEETPTDTMQGRALPAGATAVSTGAVTPYPTSARATASKPSSPTVVGRPHGPQAAVRRTGLASWVIVLGVLAVLVVAAIGVAAAAIVIPRQQEAAHVSGTATALALAASNATPTASPTLQATPMPSSFAGTVKINNAELRSSSSESGSVIGLLPAGAKLTIRARSADNAWLRVEATDGTAGWVSVAAIELDKGISIAEIPQAIALITPTLPPDLTATAAACKPEAQVTDVSVPDGTQFRAGETFVKIWRFQSSGNCSWDQGARLVFQSGDKLGPDSVPVDWAEVGASVQVSMTMKAPQTPGTHKSVWAFQRPSGEVIATAETSIVVLGPTPTRAAPTPTPAPAAQASATPGQASGVIGPVGSGPLDAAWTGGFGYCAFSQKVDTDGNGYWVWEADFPVEVHGGNAGYTINSSACRWDFGEQKYFCRWSAREDGAVSQSVTVSCPNCKQVVVAIQASAQRKGTACVQK